MTRLNTSTPELTPLTTVLVSPIVGIHYLQKESDNQWWCELLTESGHVVAASGNDADAALRAAVAKAVGV